MQLLQLTQGDASLTEATIPPPTWIEESLPPPVVVLALQVSMQAPEGFQSV